MARSSSSSWTRSARNSSVILIESWYRSRVRCAQSDSFGRIGGGVLAQVRDRIRGISGREYILVSASDAALVFEANIGSGYISAFRGDSLASAAARWTGGRIGTRRIAMQIRVAGGWAKTPSHELHHKRRDIHEPGRPQWRAGLSVLAFAVSLGFALGAMASGYAIKEQSASLLGTAFAG